MARNVHVHIHGTTHDWNESDHPRKDNGEFGTGGSAAYKRDADAAHKQSTTAKSDDDHDEAGLAHAAAAAGAHHDEDVENLHQHEFNRHRRIARVLRNDPKQEKRMSAYNEAGNEAAQASLHANTPDDHDEAGLLHGTAAEHARNHETTHSLGDEHDRISKSHYKHAREMRKAGK